MRQEASSCLLLTNFQSWGVLIDFGFICTTICWTCLLVEKCFVLLYMDYVRAMWILVGEPAIFASYVVLALHFVSTAAQHGLFLLIAIWVYSCWLLRTLNSINLFVSYCAFWSDLEGHPGFGLWLLLCLQRQWVLTFLRTCCPTLSLDASYCGCYLLRSVIFLQVTLIGSMGVVQQLDSHAWCSFQSIPVSLGQFRMFHLVGLCWFLSMWKFYFFTLEVAYQGADIDYREETVCCTLIGWLVYVCRKCANGLTSPAYIMIRLERDTSPHSQFFVFHNLHKFRLSSKYNVVFFRSAMSFQVPWVTIVDFMEANQKKK